MTTIILQRYNNPIEANIAKGLLKANGIFSFLQDEHSIGINPLYNIALGGIKWIVLAEDEERSRALLSEPID